jgi:hypothetical protein
VTGRPFQRRDFARSSAAFKLNALAPAPRRRRGVLRLVWRDDRGVPLLLTLCDECGNEIDSATAPSDDAAIRMAIRLLRRNEAFCSSSGSTPWQSVGLVRDPISLEQ